MTRLVVLSICLVLALTFNSVKCASIEKSDSNIEVSVVESFDDFLAENPDVDILDPLYSEPLFEDQSARANITYKAGNRINGRVFWCSILASITQYLLNLLGDSLKATDSKSYSWASLQNLNVTLAYPANGTASIVTYIQVNVTQVELNFFYCVSFFT